MLKRRYITRSLVFAAFATVLAVGVSQLLVQPPAVHAALAYNPANLMNDELFADKTTMSTSQIQSFLTQENSGLASYKDVENCGSTSGAHYDFYNTYYDCGKSVSAAQIIHDSAQAYSINPQVILATMQKEQSLVTTPDPTQSQLDCAMGYYSCGSGFDTFFSQVDNGSWQFRTYIELMSGNNYWGYGPSSYPCSTAGYITAHNSSGKSVSMRVYSTGLYPGRSVTFDNPTVYYYNQSDQKWEIGGGKNPPVPKTITIGSHATAALYCYTPYVGPYSDTGYSGSYNFVQSFEQWFGSTQARISVSPIHFENPEQIYTDSPTTASFTLQNASNSTIYLHELIIAARAPDGSNVDFPPEWNISIAPGHTYTYRETTTFNGAEGTYSFYIARNDGTTWHYPPFDDYYQDFDGTTTLTLGKQPTLTSALSLSSSVIHANQMLTASFTITNGGTQNATVGYIGVAARDSKNHNVDFPYSPYLTLSPGQSYTYSQSRTLPSADTYNLFIANYRNSTGWTSTFPVSETAGMVRSVNYDLQNEPRLTSPLVITQSSNTLTATFTVKNFSSVSVNIGNIGVATRDSENHNVDFPYISNLTLAADESYTYSQSQVLGYSSYHFWVADLRSGMSWSDSFPTSQDSSMARSADLTVQ